MLNAINGLLFVCLISFSVFAQPHDQNHEKAPLDIPYLPGQINIDGSIDEAQWQDAKVISLNFVTRPYENTKPPVITQVRIFENGDTLFIAVQSARSRHK